MCEHEFIPIMSVNMSVKVDIFIRYHSTSTKTTSHHHIDVIQLETMAFLFSLSGIDNFELSTVKIFACKI